MLRFLLLLIALAAPATAQDRRPLVLAASSLQEAMTDAADAWAKQGHPRPVIAFAASSALARQVEAGAPADLFVSADEAWMDVVERAGHVAPGTRATLTGNRLVVVARAFLPYQLTRENLGRTLASGRVAMADPKSVPAGRYGEAALRRMGAWAQVAPNIVRAENVRAALALVERGAAVHAIVYLTDARASKKVRIVGIFPTASHPPIRYPIARLKRGDAQAERFRRFLLGREGQAILARRGFTRG